jgi:hypothetical protein
MKNGTTLTMMRLGTTVTKIKVHFTAVTGATKAVQSQKYYNSMTPAGKM